MDAVFLPRARPSTPIAGNGRPASVILLLNPPSIFILSFVEK